MDHADKIRLYGAAAPEGEDSRLTARRLLAFAVEDAWGWTRLPALERGPWGKPAFADRPHREFNLSHTAGLCLCALSEAGPVGVDIERVRPRRAGLPRYVMSGEELAAFDGTWERFYEVWTMKEALCKYQGRSIFPPRAVPAPPPVPYRCFSGDGWRAALCGGGALPDGIEWVDSAALRQAY